MLYVSPTQSQIQISLVNFLISILPAGVPVYMMQDNRVSEPSNSNFVVLNPLNRPRFATNIDNYSDITAQGSITGAVMHVASVAGGSLVAGLPIQGASVQPNTVLGIQQSGTPGGAGDYAVSPSQTLPASQLFTMGTASELQKTEIIMQMDVHGPASSDNVQVISTMFRDPYAVDFFEAQGYDVIPLFSETPRQLPFVNAEDQYETRWSCDLHLEANQVVYNIPQQFAASLELDLIEVDATYPA